MSGLNEFENLGDETTAKGKKEEDSEGRGQSRRSLQKDFEEAAAEYPEELVVEELVEEELERQSEVGSLSACVRSSSYNCFDV